MTDDGTHTIDGVETTEYSADVNLTSLLNAANPQLEQSLNPTNITIPDAPLKIWIDKQGLPRQLTPRPVVERRVGRRDREHHAHQRSAEGHRASRVGGPDVQLDQRLHCEGRASVRRGGCLTLSGASQLIASTLILGAREESDD